MWRMACEYKHKILNSHLAFFLPYLYILRRWRQTIDSSFKMMSAKLVVGRAGDGMIYGFANTGKILLEKGMNGDVDVDETTEYVFRMCILYDILRDREKHLYTNIPQTTLGSLVQLLQRQVGTPKQNRFDPLRGRVLDDPGSREKGLTQPNIYFNNSEGIFYTLYTLKEHNDYVRTLTFDTLVAVLVAVPLWFVVGIALV